MHKSIITKGVISLLVLVGGWASPSILVSSQETDTLIEEVPTVAVVERPVSLELTSRDIVIEHGEELNPQELVVAGYYDTLSLPVFDTSSVGQQTIAFKATRDNDQVTVHKTISVIDTTKPVFDEAPRTIKVDYEEDAPVEEIVSFFKASDNVDGELEVMIEGTYDSTEPGEHPILAYAVDSSGNRVDHKFVIKVAEKPVPVHTYETYKATGSYGTANTYAPGWCTWHVANRRIEIGRPLPNTLGNAYTWVGRAQAYGMATGNTPAVGAVVYPSYNHVAFVEQVSADGSIFITEMGWGYAAWGYNSRWIPASTASSLTYIY